GPPSVILAPVPPAGSRWLGDAGQSRGGAFRPGPLLLQGWPRLFHSPHAPTSARTSATVADIAASTSSEVMASPPSAPRPPASRRRTSPSTRPRQAATASARSAAPRTGRPRAIPGRRCRRLRGLLLPSAAHRTGPGQADRSPGRSDVLDRPQVARRARTRRLGASRSHRPGAVRLLMLEEIRLRAADRRVRALPAGGDVEREARREGVALHLGGLPPPAVRVLPAQQGFQQRPGLFHGLTEPLVHEQAQHERLLAVGGRVPGQPV